eukprot:CAMPEP_0168185936 /NCGR_PEP_ID=MMETSP0139_2-20121125/14131_1 /TAXON_ID=44445 /ORGANISM="Pseudo-nitzschia australis, Strain 10249 10 AB" /LENGTH=370 /DNA_ID=CAMNT_0008107843 /DNA_START=197 /DNA_END=1309 /DNA_ORIENTATION=+
MMTIPNSFLLALVVLVSASAVLAQDDNSTACSTIAEIICDEKANLNAVCEAIIISELDDDLEQDTWTVFVPTDDAFEALGRDNLDSMVFGNDTVPLTDLVLFHVVPGVALTSDLLPCQAGVNLLEMANGHDSRTKCEGGIPTFQKGPLNSKADPPQIIDADIAACNGVVHILDKVMLYEELPYPMPELFTETGTEEPTDAKITKEIAVTAVPTEASTLEEPEEVPDQETEEESKECQTIADFACSNPRFTVLCALLTESGLVDDLSDGMWTVFAPNNQAFDDAPPFLAETDINFILQGHVVANEAIRFEDLNCTETIEMLNSKKTRTVCKKGATFQNGVDNDDQVRPEIVANNIEACNGIVHVIDQVILS